jgi:2-phosphosulfolactate phosphatase
VTAPAPAERSAEPVTASTDAARPPSPSAARRRRLDVVLTADAVEGERLRGATVLVVDVLRASTTMIAALRQGAAAIVPVATPDDARRRAAALGDGALLAGERDGERIAGFDLGNSPLETSADRVRARVVIFTTSNGTRALLAARPAAAVGIAAFVNLSAAVAWADAATGDVTVICAGERGRVSVEDRVCAGLLVERLRGRVAGAEVSETAAAAAAVARPYANDVSRLALDSPWALRLAGRGHGPDVAACLTLDTTALVPVYLADVDKVVSRPR